MRPTIKEIARIAGVTHATVSMVLNDKKGISKEVSQKIKKIAEEIGYVPNINARNLVNQKTDTLGIFLLNFPENREDRIFYYYNELIQDLIVEGRKKGYSILIFTDRDDTKREISYAKFCLEHNIKTALFLGIVKDDPNLEEIKKLKHTQVILFDVENTINCNNIISNSFSGIYEMMLDFKGKDFKRIAVIQGKESAEISTQKKKMELGLLKEEFGIEIDYYPGDWFKESGYLVGKTIDVKKYEGIFAMNDAMAIGVLEALKERSIKIPEEISLVGYDSLAVTEIITPKISSIAHNNLEIVKNIFEIIEKPEELTQVVIPTTFQRKDT